MNLTPAEQGLAWQIGAWDRMAEPYQREVDRRLALLVDGVINRAALRSGNRTQFIVGTFQRASDRC